MIEEDREKRIEAAIIERFRGRFASNARERVEAILDAADAAVPVVSKAYVDEHYVERWKLMKRTADLKRAEAAARDFANALRQISRRSDETDPTSEYHIATNALAAHPDFAEPSKPDEEEQ